MHTDVVVWGNCQAGPLGRLLTAPLAAAGLTVVPVPPVFEVDPAGLERVREVVSGAAVLLTQPVRDEYRVRGCGSEQLAALLPAGARVVRFTPTFHVGPFPTLVNGHGADGERVDAPLTVYHDLRLVAAAVGEPFPSLTPAGVRTVDAASVAELRRREAPLDIPVSGLLDRPDALHVFDHPTNAVLAEVARAVLRHLGIDGEIEVPVTEMLGATRAPVDPAVVDALGWTPRAHWTVEGRDLDPAEVTAAHAALYRERPDVAADTWTRYAGRRGDLTAG